MILEPGKTKGEVTVATTKKYVVGLFRRLLSSEFLSRLAAATIRIF